MLKSSSGYSARYWRKNVFKVTIFTPLDISLNIIFIEYKKSRTRPWHRGSVLFKMSMNITQNLTLPQSKNCQPNQKKTINSKNIKQEKNPNLYYL